MPRSVLIRANVCGWVPGWVALLYQGLFTGVTDPSASSGCGLGPTSNWSEIGWRCCQRPRNGGLGMSDLKSHWLAERLAYLGRSLSRDTMWGQKVRDTFLPLESSPKPKVTVSRGVNHRSPASAVRPSITFLGPVTFLGFERNFIGI